MRGKLIFDKLIAFFFQFLNKGWLNFWRCLFGFMHYYRNKLLVADFTESWYGNCTLKFWR